MVTRRDLLATILLFFVVLCPRVSAWQDSRTADTAFKISLFRRAIRLGVPPSEEALAIETSIALGEDTFHREWLKKLPKDEQAEAINSIARYAAHYLRPVLALRAVDQLEDSGEKLDTWSRIALALGHKQDRGRFDTLLKRLGAVDLAAEDVAKWRETFWFTYHTATVSRMEPAAALNTTISTRLLRDTIRMQHARAFAGDARHAQAMDAIHEMESSYLRTRAAYVLATRTPEPAGQRLFAEALLESLSLGENVATDYADSDTFAFGAFNLEETGVPAKLNPLARLVVEDSFEISFDSLRLNVSKALKACCDSGVCQDGLKEAALFKNEGQRKLWLECVLQRLENRGELEAALKSRRRIKQQYGIEVGRDDRYPERFAKEAVNDDAYLKRLTKLACRREEFELAESFAARIGAKRDAEDARFTIAAFRRRPGELEKVLTVPPNIKENFHKQLAAVPEGDQLMWLYKRSLEHGRGTDQLLFLFDTLVEEVARRKSSKSRKRVLKAVTNAIHSMTPLSETSARLMKAFHKTLSVNRNSEDAIGKVLQRLRRQDFNAPPEKKRAIFDLCVRFSNNIEDEDERDYALARISLAYARRGDRDAVIKLDQMFSTKEARFASLLHCAVAFPPATTPAFGAALAPGGFSSGAGFF